MRAITLLFVLFVLASFHSPVASTWNGTAGNQLLTGAALRDGGPVSGLYTVDVAIPSGDNLLIVSNTYIIAHTNVGGAPSQPGNRCPTKDAFISQF